MQCTPSKYPARFCYINSPPLLQLWSPCSDHAESDHQNSQLTIQEVSSNTCLKNFLPEWAKDCFNIWLIISPLFSSVQAPILGVAWSLPTFSPEHPALSPSFSVWSSLLGVSLCFLLSSLGFVTLQPVTASGHQPVSLPSAPVFASHHVASLLKTVDNRLRYKVPPPK